ncbi:hypothetical protein PIB30_091508, partial [Stylosanthes scabra]|nr:hypothetical protein [Stylosanthes scabra]
ITYTRKTIMTASKTSSPAKLMSFPSTKAAGAIVNNHHHQQQTAIIINIDKTMSSMCFPSTKATRARYLMSEEEDDD